LPLSPAVRLTGGNDARLLVDGNAEPAISQALEGARSVINIAMFSWLDSGSGHRIAEILKRKARQGVEVNIQLDQVGSLLVPGTSSSRMVHELEAAGVHVVRSNHFALTGAQYVDHRKIYVIDGNTAFVGGMNLSKTYDGWHDVMVRVQGPAAAMAGVEFLRRWRRLGGSISARQSVTLGDRQAQLGAMHVGFSVNDPRTGMELTQTYLNMIAHAQHRLWVESPWLGDEKFAKALADAARRGVDVRVVLPAKKTKSGIPVVGLLSESFFPMLRAAGVKIYTQQRMTHTKLLLADDVATVGSMNLSNRSSSHDHEFNVVVNSPDFATSVERLIVDDISHSNDETHASETPLLSLARMLHIQY
jgi:cardiolipin synthase